MSEPVNIEDKKQNNQKPPLSIGRIAGEILAGTATGLAVALPLTCVTAFLIVDEGSEFAVFGVLAIFIIVFPPLYGLASALGVYLLGKIGKQTGSLLLALLGGLVGGLITYLTFPLANYLSDVMQIILGLLSPLVLLIPPILATVGFNLTRRYK